MQQNTKLAPYFKAQSKQCDRLSDWLILVGEGAYYAYFDRKKQAGKGEQWQLIRDAYQFSTDRQPVILDSKSFAEIDRLFLAPTEQAFIKIFQVGENLQSFKQAFPDALRDSGQTEKLIEIGVKNGYTLLNIHWKDRITTIQRWENG